MAVYNTDSMKNHVYVGTGDYEVSFEYDVTASIKVVWVDSAGTISAVKEEDVDYSIVVDASIAYVRVLIDFGTGGIISIYRDVPNTQTYTWVDGTTPAPSAIMRAIDRVVWMVQQVVARLSGTLKTPANEDLDMTIPPISERASSIHGYDAAGLPIAFASVPAAATSAYVEAGLISANEAAFHNYYGIPTGADIRTHYIEQQAYNNIATSVSQLFGGIGFFIPTATATSFSGAVFVPKGYFPDSYGGEGSFCIVTLSGTTASIWTESPRGKNGIGKLSSETPRTTFTAASVGGIAISDDGETIVIVYEDTGTALRSYYSADYGETWASALIHAVADDRDIKYVNGKFCASAQQGYVFTSSDGITWATKDLTTWGTGVSYSSIADVVTGRLSHYTAAHVESGPNKIVVDIYDGSTWVNTEITGLTYTAYSENFIVSLKGVIYLFTTNSDVDNVPPGDIYTLDLVSGDWTLLGRATSERNYGLKTLNGIAAINEQSIILDMYLGDVNRREDGQIIPYAGQLIALQSAGTGGDYLVAHLNDAMSTSLPTAGKFIFIGRVKEIWNYLRSIT